MGSVRTATGSPRLSAEIFSIPLGGDSFIVYAPLRRAAFVANARLVNVLADLRDGVVDASLDPEGALVEFLRRLEILDAGAERQPIADVRGGPEPTTVSLFLTTACNLRCTYCYASAGETPVKFMSLDVAARGIDFVAANAAAKRLSAFELAYHGGGEPFMNWHALTASLAYARDKAAALGLDVVASSATNGMLNDQQTDWIVANLSGVSLSYDGLPAANDKHRLTIDGSRSSERIQHTMRRFDEAGFRYGVRVTVTLDQIPSLPDSIEFICRNFGVERIQVEPVYQLGRWSDAASAETDDFIASYREAQRRAQSCGREIVYSAARLDTLTNHFCGVSQDSFCLSPDGNVSACYEAFSEQNAWADVFFYGRPDRSPAGGYEFDPFRVDHLRRQAVQYRPYCQGCFAKWHCAGDCYHKALAFNGEGAFGGSARCHVNRELTKDQILAHIAASGGLFWHAPSHEPAVVPESVKEFLP